MSWPATVIGSARERSTPPCTRWKPKGCCGSRAEVVAGRARRSYAATAKGKRELKQAKQQLRELARELLDVTTR